MKELELISKTTPAVVSFNYAEIDAQLDVTLKKYSGLVFTEATLKECKKTLSELKKGQKSLSDFRIKTKKLLTEDITKFEDQCKLLSTKFNTVISPISEQADQFEVDRRENKNIEIKLFIHTLQTGLTEKYSTQLIVTDQMLNKGTSIKSIKEDLTKQAELLLSQQTIEASNIELIKSKVELAIATFGVPLLDTQYVDMLEYKEIAEIIKMITEDAEALKTRNEEIELQKVIRAEKLEADKVAAAARKAEREAKILEEKAKQVKKIVEITPVIGKPPVKVEVVQATFKAPEVVKPEIFFETYEITGTEIQLDDLESFLAENNYGWNIKEEK